MSNPYGPPEPGEPTPYVPYGGPAPSGAGAPSGGQGMDPVSLTGFVLSLLCCTSLVGLVLGAVGLRRTKNGARQGRWAAVAAVVIGAVGTLVFAGGLVFFVWFGTSTVFVESAEVGQCVDVDEFSGSTDATIWERECGEPHEAEIVVADDLTASQAADFDADDPDAACAEDLSDAYADALASGDYELGLVVESDEPESGDPYVCYLERVDGAELDDAIVD